METPAVSERVDWARLHRAFAINYSVGVFVGFEWAMEMLAEDLANRVRNYALNETIFRP